MIRMRWVVLLSCVLGGCAAEVGDPDITETSADGLINGRYTFERPEVGSIRVGGGACTATLFGSARTVITAAHCIDYQSSRGPGSYGDFTLEPRPGERYRYTIRQMVAFGTTYGASEDDVALLQLAEEVPSSVAVPDAPAGAHPASGSSITIYGFGCQRRGGGGSSSFAKQAFPTRWGQSSYNLCPGDSGGPTLGADGSVLRVNSAYIVGEGRDLFGDVVRHLSDLRRYADTWRGTSPLVWVGDAPPPSDPPPSDPPPSDPPPSDPPPSDPPPSDPPPSDPPPSDPPPSDPPPSGGVEGRCNAHTDCEVCTEDDHCGWCNSGCHSLTLGPSGRLQGVTCTQPPLIAPWSCPAPDAPPPPPPPATPSPSSCGGWSGFTEYTCHADRRQFIRCGAAGIEVLVCPSGYACQPGSTELLCYYGP